MNDYREYRINIYKHEITQAEANGMRLSEYRLFRNSIDPKIDEKFRDKTPVNYITDVEPRFTSFEDSNSYCKRYSWSELARLGHRMLRMQQIIVPLAAYERPKTMLYETCFYGDTQYNKALENAKADYARQLAFAVTVFSENRHSQESLTKLKSDDETIKMLIEEYINSKISFDIHYPLTLELANAWWDEQFKNYILSRHQDDEGNWIDCFDDPEVPAALQIVKTFFNQIWYNYTKYNLIVNRHHKIGFVFVPYHTVQTDIIRRNHWAYNPDATVILCHGNGMYEALTVEGYRQFVKSKMYNKYELMPHLEELPVDSGYYNQLRTLENWLDTHDWEYYGESMRVHSPEDSFEYEQFKINRIFGDETDDYRSEGLDDDDGFIKKKCRVSEKEYATYHINKRQFKFVVGDLHDLITKDDNSKTWIPHQDNCNGRNNHIITNPVLDLFKNPKVMLGDCGRAMQQLGLDAVYQCKQYNWILADIEHLCYENGNIVYTCPVCGKQNIIPGIPTLTLQTVCCRCETVINFQAGLPNLKEKLDVRDIDPNWIGTDDEEADTRTTFKFGGDTEEDY